MRTADTQKSLKVDGRASSASRTDPDSRRAKFLKKTDGGGRRTKVDEVRPATRVSAWEFFGHKIRDLDGNCFCKLMGMLVSDNISKT